MEEANLVRPSFVDLANGVVMEPEPIEQFDMMVDLDTMLDVPVIKPQTIDAEHIKTFLRIRPPHINKNSKNVENESDIFEIQNPTTLLLKHGKKSMKYYFSTILDKSCTQVEVFEECVRPNLEKFYGSAENCLFFSYGATNSGKTYTMQGAGQNFGIIPRSFDFLFNCLEDSLYTKGDIKPHNHNEVINISKDEALRLDEVKQKLLGEIKKKPIQLTDFRDSFVKSNASFNSSIVGAAPNLASVPSTAVSDSLTPDENLYSVWISYVEIYNEKVYDLFDIPEHGKKRVEKKLHTNTNGSYVVKDLTEVNVNTAEEAYQLFMVGKNNLRFAATLMNTNSSRSHSVFTIRLLKLRVTNKYVMPIGTPTRMSFCDLAGTERVSQTGNKGLRLHESGSINQSLLVLIRCIRALRERQHGKKILIPYRDSKLTQLFHVYLTGPTHIQMITNVNLTTEFLDSTIHVLTNAAIANKVLAFKKIEPLIPKSKFGKALRKSIKATRTAESSFQESKSCSDILDLVEIAEDDEERNRSNTEDLSDTENKEPVTAIRVIAPAVLTPHKINVEIVTASDDGKDEIIRHLNKKVRQLKEKCLTIEMKTKEELHNYFTNIIEQMKKEYDEAQISAANVRENINGKRLSLVKQAFKRISFDVKIQEQNNHNEEEMNETFATAAGDATDQDIFDKEGELHNKEKPTHQPNSPEIKDLSRELMKKDSRIKELEYKIENLEESYEQTIKEMEEENISMKNEISTLRQNLNDIQNQNERDHGDILKELNKKKADCEVHLSDMKKFAELQKDFDDGVQIAAQYFNQIEILNKRIDELNSNIFEYHAKLENSKFETDNLLSNNYKLSGEIKNLKESIDSMDSENRTLRKKCGTLAGNYQLQDAFIESDSSSATSGTVKARAVKVKKEPKEQSAKDQQLPETSNPRTRSRKKNQSQASSKGSTNGFNVSGLDDSGDEELFNHSPSKRVKV